MGWAVYLGDGGGADWAAYLGDNGGTCWAVYLGVGEGLVELLLPLVLLEHLAAAVRLVHHHVKAGRVREGRLSCPTCVHHSAWHNVASGCLMVRLASPIWLYVSMMELLIWVGVEVSPSPGVFHGSGGELCSLELG